MEYLRLISRIKQHLQSPEIVTLAIAMAQVVQQHPPGLTEPCGLQKMTDEVKVPEFDMTDDQESQVGTKDTEVVQDLKFTSGPVLTMPGATDLPSLEDMNAQFLCHQAYYDVTSTSRQKPSLAMKSCLHPPSFRRHNRNQYGFTIHCSNCNCRLLFAKKYDVQAVNGHCQLTQRINTVKGAAQAGTASQKQHIDKTLTQLMEQNGIQNALQLALRQRTIQAEHPVYIAYRPAHGLSQEFLVQQINILATTLTHQMQSQQEKALEKTLEAMRLQQEATQLQQERSLSMSLEVMQNGQRDMVAKLNELNIGNFNKFMIINRENQMSLLEAVKPGSCQMQNGAQ